jgi:hypothetical protein
MGFVEQSDAEMSAAINKHWREVAEYDRYVTPLIVRLESVEWRTVLALHGARWHRRAVEAIRARTPRFHYCSSALAHQELIKASQAREPSSYGWLGSYYDARTGKYLQIQRYPLLYVHDTGTYPVRFCPPEGRPVSGHFWFQTSDFKSHGWTPETRAWLSYESQYKLNPRQYLADRLRAASLRLGGYSNPNGFLAKEAYQLKGVLEAAIGGNSSPNYSGDVSSSELGEIKAKWDSFSQYLNEFHEAERSQATISETLAKGTPAADVRRYFPDVATIHGSTATDANALQQLTVWLLHWAERHSHQPASSEYSLAGRLRKQQAAHPNAGKFLKACRRLHEALLPLAADEIGVKQLLGKEYGSHSRTNLISVLKWWASWIKEQQLTHDDPTGAYLAALRRVPVVEEWENGSPRYNLPTHLGIYDEFEAEIAPLRQAFEAVLPDLPTKKNRALRAVLNELLSIDRTGVQRRREQFERGEYGLDFLLADYPALRFDVAGQAGAFKWQWVSPMFWGGLNALLQYKQQAARAAWEQLAAAHPEAGGLSEVPAALPASLLLTPAATRTLYLKLLEHPALVGELTAYQKSELRAYADAEQLAATRLAVEIMDSNPQYDYPAAYRNGREVDYWQAKNLSYADSKRVLRLLASPAPASGLPLAIYVADNTTVGDLCRAGLTLADLKDLLIRLAVIDTTGKCLTNNLKGKAQGKRGAFTAAYRVLHRAGLLAPTATDKEWAGAFKKEYEAELGTDVIAHKLTQHGQASSRAPGPFQQAVADATEWVSEWKSRQQS